MINLQLTVFLQRQTHKKYAKTRVAGYHRVHASSGHSCVQRLATRCISHNEPAGTYTLVYEYCSGGIGSEGQNRSSCCGVASVMLQVQCISLPKRFVPSVSKCPSVVCLRASLSLSLFLSFSYSLNLHDLRPSISPGRYRFARANTFSREKEGEHNPRRLIARAHTRGQRSHVN